MVRAVIAVRSGRDNLCRIAKNVVTLRLHTSHNQCHENVVTNCDFKCNILSENARIWLIQAPLQASRPEYIRNFVSQTSVKNLQDAAQSDNSDSDGNDDDRKDKKAKREKKKKKGMKN